MSYEFITAEQKGRVGIITLNRPKQLNALSPGLMTELGSALLAFDADAGVAVERDERASELRHQLRAERVELLRPVERDDAHPALLLHRDEFIAHAY